MAGRADCYGDMFPDLERLRYNESREGRAFAVVVESRGIGVSGRRVEVKAESWRQCTACAHYRDCYDLSMARMLLGLALRQHS